MLSQKDISENMITGKLIKNAFSSLKDEGLLENTQSSEDTTGEDPVFFIRRLRHLQHLCQSIEGVMKNQDNTVGKRCVTSLAFTTFNYLTQTHS